MTYNVFSGTLNTTQSINFDKKMKHVSSNVIRCWRNHYTTHQRMLTDLLKTNVFLEFSI